MALSRSRWRSLAFLSIFCSALYAQDKPKTQQKHIVQDSAHELIIPYVTLEPGWRTNLEVRNNLAGRSVWVGPFLRLSNGREIELPAVQIKSDETKTLDLGGTLDKIETNLNGKSGTFGSVVLRYSSPSSGNIYAAGMVERTGAPISYHFDAATVNSGYAAGEYEGLWWLPNETVTAYLILTNSSSESVQPEVSWIGDNGRTKEKLDAIGPHQTQRIDVRSAISRAKITSNFGGVRLSVTDHVGAIQLQHIMFDETAKFSAIMRTAPRDLSGTIAGHTLRAPMVALTNPDPALAFPDGTKLHSRIFVRNATASALPVVAHINWRSDLATGTVPLEIGTLQPEEARLIDLSALQASNAIPKEANWAGIHLSYRGRYGDIVATGAAYSDDLRYGAQSPFRETIAGMWKGGMWKVDGTHNSLITAGNGDTKPVTVAFSLFNADGTLRYDMPDRILQPGEQMWVDVGKLVHSGMPDRNGNTLPPTVISGSYQVEDTKHPPIGHLFEGKLVLDKTSGHAAYGCALCCGWDTAWQISDPLGLAAGYDSSQILYSQSSCDGSQWDFTGSSYGWNSTDTSIATASSPDVWGMAPGTAYVYGFVDLQGSGNGGYYDVCPTQTLSTMSTVVVSPVVKAISPSRGLIGTTTVVDITGTGLAGATSIQLGDANISVSIVSNTDTDLKVNISPAASATAGSHNVTVTAGGQTSNNDKIFFVQVPTSLKVLSVSVLPNGSSPPAGCPQSDPTDNFGLLTDIKYQVLDQDTTPQPVQSSSMTPHESGTSFFGNLYDTNIGPVTGYPTSALTTASDGTYHDVPFGVCVDTTFNLTGSQS